LPDTATRATGHISSASARRRRLIAESRPVDIQPLELEPLVGGSIGTPASPTRFAVLPSSIWELQEQKTSRSFLRHLRSQIKDRLVAVLDPDDVRAPEAAYVFLVDELEDTVPHMLAWRDETWTDLKTGHGFVMTEHGFRPVAGEDVAPEDWPLEAYWVEYAENGVIRNKKRVGW